MGNPLQNLVVDKWYKALAVVSGAILVLGIATEVRVLDNATWCLIGAGGLFIGFGEWVNHPLQTKVPLPSRIFPAGTVFTSYNRLPGFQGNTLDLIGLSFLAWAAGRHLFK